MIAIQVNTKPQYMKMRMVSLFVIAVWMADIGMSFVSK